MLNKNCPDGAAVGEYLDLVVGDGFHECCLRCSKILESEGTAAELVGVVVLVLLHGWLHHLLLNELSSTITSISSWSVFVIAKAVGTRQWNLPMHTLRVLSAQRGHVSPVKDCPWPLHETCLHGLVGRQVQETPDHDVGGGVYPLT